MNCQRKTVIPLPVLAKNEQKYADVVDSLDHYEDIVIKVFDAARKDVNAAKLHIGGDQLTRELVFGAKCLRLGGLSEGRHLLTSVPHHLNTFI